MRHWLTALAMIFWAASGVQAETRAVLVGVSDYDNSFGLADLRGPKNDVILLDQVLRGRGVSDITLLADGVEGATRPTRAAILGAFDDVLRRLEPDDFVYIHLSGHGTRQSDLNADETDGLDEVFLPADTARAEPGQTTIPNALVDDEIGAAVRLMREAGANVWLVMDSCHSGSGLRAASTNTAARFADPATLGIDVTANPRPEAEIVESLDDVSGGGYLAFYAARSSEVAREVNMAAEGDPEAWYGLFSAKLATRLQSGGAISFRQLFQGVLSDLNGDGVPGVARLQTPSWEGSLIDAAVFGGGATTGLRRFAVTGDEIAAGFLHGMAEGTLVGLVADPADPPDALIGYAQTEDATATLSYLRAVAKDCVPLSGAPCAASGRLPDTARYAQIIARPVDRKTRIGQPRDLASGAVLAADHPAQVALAQAVAEVNQGSGQGVELSPDDYTVETVWDGDALWFGPRAVVGETPTGLRWVPADGALAPTLTRIARAEEMARMLGAVAQGGSILSPSPVAVTARLNPVDVNELAEPDSGVSPMRECRAALAHIDAAAAQPLEARADVKQCDQLSFAVQGRTPGARDVNRVHIDAQFCISVKYERIDDTAAPRRLGGDMTMCSDCPGGFAAGEERLFVVVTEAAPNSESLNLEGLVENCTAAGGTRGAASTQAIAFLGQIAARPDTRGSMGALGVSNIWVEDYNWRVLPRREAFLKAGRPVQD